AQHLLRALTALAVSATNLARPRGWAFLISKYTRNLSRSQQLGQSGEIRRHHAVMLVRRADAADRRPRLLAKLTSGHRRAKIQRLRRCRGFDGQHVGSVLDDLF